MPFDSCSIVVKKSFLCVLVIFICIGYTRSQNYFRKYIDSEEHYDEFNGQVFVNNNNIFLLNYISSDTSNFSGILELDAFGNVSNVTHINEMIINYNGGYLIDSNFVIVGSNNSNNPESRFMIRNINMISKESSSYSFELFDSTNNITLIPIGTIKFDSSTIIYGQFSLDTEHSSQGFLLWLDSGFEKDSLMILGEDLDWSIISDAAIDNEGQLVVVLETVNQADLVEHHQRHILKYDQNKNLVFEWTSKEFYSTQGLANIGILESGTVILEFVDDTFEFDHKVIAINSLGEVEWEWQMPRSPLTSYNISDIFINHSDDIILAGNYRNISDYIISTGFVMKLNSEGTLIWERIFVDNDGYSSGESDFKKAILFQSVDEINSRDLVIGGRVFQYFGEENENSDIFFAIIDSEGCLISKCSGIQNISSLGDFLDSTFTWTETYTDNISSSSWSLKYTIDSVSTEIAGKNYYEILKTDYENSITWKGTGNYIRYENNFVYMPPIQNDERILYNFNLEVGDTFDLVTVQGVLIVESIDTVTLLNGELRRRWKLRCIEDEFNEYGTEWIAGIGNTKGILAHEEMCQIDGIESKTLCMFKNDELIYQNEELNDCWVETTALNNLIKEKFLVYPNPAQNIINVLGDENMIDRIEIYNNLGYQILESEDILINIEHFSRGFYFLVVTYKNNKRCIKKFVKL